MISEKKQKLCSSLYSSSFTDIYKDDRKDRLSAEPELHRRNSVDTYCNPMYYKFVYNQKMSKKLL